MIEEIRIQGLGVIEESVLELGRGFTAVTGETGAGKTMVVTALGLLLGGRADSGAVRTGATRARVEGLWSLDAQQPPDIAATVVDAGGEIDDGALVLARQVGAEGRSRAFAGGVGVPATVLAQLAPRLVAVHGQSDQHRLLQPSAQREALDRYAGPRVHALRARFGELFADLRATETELAEVRAAARERAREADLLRFGVDEVARVAPQPGEDVDLAAEEARLGFADTLRGAADQAHAALSSDDDAPDALTVVGEARRLLDNVREHDPRAGDLADRLAEVTYLLADVAADLASYTHGLESDPVRLAAVSERRAALTALQRKYGDSVEEVLAWAASATRRLEDLDDTDGRIARLVERCRALVAELAVTGEGLTVLRTEAAGRLAVEVTAELAALAMPHARLEVSVAQHDEEGGIPLGARTVRAAPHGLDEVELRLAANAGGEPRPLAKGASGGELSRVMLGIEVVLAATDRVPTYVFDEVDAGVGGKAAVEVGRRLAALAAAGAQVVVVTHLPQVAAFADHHVTVVKAQDGLVTASGLTVLDEPGRVRELSRMLAGLEGSSTAEAHAMELLATARGQMA